MSRTQFNSSLSSANPRQKRSALVWLIIAALVTVALWQVPWGNYILYPFTILATWFHEMAHGLTAMLLGADFQQLQLYPNGSGVAMYRYDSTLLFGSVGLALIAAGGPLGPAIAGAIFILAGRHQQTAHYCLLALCAMLTLSALIWVRSSFGLMAVGSLAVLILIIASQTPYWVQSFAIQFLGVQACVSVYRQLDYLFMHSATIGGKLMTSDTGQMADNLFFPHWFWGLTIAVVSLLLLINSLRLAYR